MYNIYSILPNDVKNNNKGIKAHKDKEFDKAIEFFDKVKDYNIKNFNKGASSYKKQDYDDALNAFSSSLNSKNSKHKLNSLYNLGNSYFKLDKINEAISSYQEALDLCINDSKSIGEAYCKEMIDKIKNNMEYVFKINEENKENNQQENKEDEKNEEEKEKQNKDQKQDENKEESNTERSQNDDKDQQEDKKNISKEQARQLLNIINEADKNIQKELLKEKSRDTNRTGAKEW